MKDNEPIILLIELDRIPSGGTVSKKTGQMQYRVVDELSIYESGISRKTLEAPVGTRLLVDDKGVANAHPNELLVHWHTTTGRLVGVPSKPLHQQTGEANPEALQSLSDWAVRMTDDPNLDDNIARRETSVRKTLSNGKTLAHCGWVQVSRKYAIVGRLPPGKTGLECLHEYAVNILKINDADKWVDGFNETQATDYWLRMNANNDEHFLELTTTQFAEFKAAGGSTAK